MHLNNLSTEELKKEAGLLQFSSVSRCFFMGYYFYSF